VEVIGNSPDSLPGVVGSNPTAGIGPVKYYIFKSHSSMEEHTAHNGTDMDSIPIGAKFSIFYFTGV
jgi:hypothetical protein